MDEVTQRPVHRFGDGADAARVDDVAVEEPLEIRVDGEPLAVTMRTPGHDRHLAVGFLFGESVIESLADVGTVAHCGRPGEEGFGNAIDVISGPGVTLDATRLEGTRRGTLTTASCGVCGRRSIDDLLERIGPVRREPALDREVLTASPDALRERQRAFERTGGLHAALALAADGAPLAHAEDVGRHNAVDKTIGRLLYDDVLEDAAILVVSGRISFEIVQKAATARVPAIVAVSAPTSLAVDLAIRADITLCGFARDGAMNVYARPDRVA